MTIVTPTTEATMITAHGIHSTSSGLAGGLAAALVEQGQARRVAGHNARVERGDAAAVQRLITELAASRRREAALQQELNVARAAALTATAALRRLRNGA
jgi:hypothetical protein